MGTGNNYRRLITIVSFIIGTGLYVNPLADMFSIHHSTDLVLIMTQLPKKNQSHGYAQARLLLQRKSRSNLPWYSATLIGNEGLFIVLCNVNFMAIICLIGFLDEAQTQVNGGVNSKRWEISFMSVKIKLIHMSFFSSWRTPINCGIFFNCSSTTKSVQAFVNKATQIPQTLITHFVTRLPTYLRFHAANFYKRDITAKMKK